MNAPIVEPLPMLSEEAARACFEREIAKYPPDRRRRP